MWVSPKQARLITGLERYQLDWLRKSGKVQAKKWQNMWLYDVGGLCKVSEQAREVLDELARFVEWTESGRHFTEAFPHWHTLEECGWIAVRRPVHPPTGIPYDVRYYRAELTDEGQQLAQYVAEQLE